MYIFNYVFHLSTPVTCMPMVLWQAMDWLENLFNSTCTISMLSSVRKGLATKSCQHCVGAGGWVDVFGCGCLGLRFNLGWVPTKPPLATFFPRYSKLIMKQLTRTFCLLSNLITLFGLNAYAHRFFFFFLSAVYIFATCYFRSMLFMSYLTSCV